MKSTEIRLYDSLSGKKKALKARSPDAFRVYCCGPTVYGYTHVGNARAALNLDLLVRVLEHFGNKVLAARNYTDIDDKIIRRAEEESKSVQEVAEFYEQAYANEMRELGTRFPDFTPRATESLAEIKSMISGLIEKNLAYTLQTEYGTDVYYRVQSFPNYGKLSKRSLDSLVEGTRAETQAGKEHPGDFALWKASKSNEPSWESPWGAGRPGWHIECSAMIAKLFDQKLDIHMGGLDLIFPHHENEIAQSEGLYGNDLAEFWVHNGMIEIDKEKMSKSLGNIMSTRSFLDRYGAETLRMLVYSHHYRSPIDFSAQSVHAAELGLRRVYHSFDRAKRESDGGEKSSPLVMQLEEAVRDDLNSAKALGFILAAARTAYRESHSENWQALASAETFVKQCFGLLTKDLETFEAEMRDRKIKRTGLSESKIEEIEALLEERQKLRLEKNFEAADSLRKKLESENISIMDSAEGSSWSISEELE